MPSLRLYNFHGLFYFIFTTALHIEMTGLVKKSMWLFFPEMKGKFFVSTNNLIDLDILHTLAMSHYWLLLGRGRCAAKHLAMHKTSPQQRIIWPRTLETIFHMVDQSQHLPHTLHKSFFAFQLYFYLY